MFCKNVLHVRDFTKTKRETFEGGRERGKKGEPKHGDNNTAVFRDSFVFGVGGAKSGGRLQFVTHF